jgi:DNA-binding PadR family transcriptional regulator
MSKRNVLEIFAANARFMTPDEVRKCLQGNSQRSSVYSYLSRLCRQGLLERAQGWARVAYRITPRGIQRLGFFQSQRESSTNR